MGSLPYTWKENGGYQAVPPPPPAPIPIMLTPVAVCLAVPLVAVPVKPTRTVTVVEATAKAEVVVASKSIAAKSVSAKSCSSKSSSAKSQKSTTSSTKSVKSAKSKSTTKPTAPLPGMKYIYPKKNTCIHVIKCVKVWESDKNFKCKAFNVGTPMTIAELIEHLTGREGDLCKGWSLTEVTEKGDGSFEKGTTIEYSTDKAGMTLAAIGWTEANGSGRPPVWLVIHK